MFSLQTSKFLLAGSKERTSATDHHGRVKPVECGGSRRIKFKDIFQSEVSWETVPNCVHVCVEANPSSMP